MHWPVEAIRTQFQGLQRQAGGGTAAFFDGPAGSQVPECVIDAVSNYLRHTNCNRDAVFPSGVESDAVLDAAWQTVAEFLGTADPDCVVFGANMTTLTFQVSRALSRQWKPGDEIIVSRLDHDANVTPWVLAAEEAGVTVHRIELDRDEWKLNLNDFREKLSPRTRLVAVGYASNATGTINPVKEMIDEAHRVGALVYIDAVHFAPHGRLQADQLNCDFLVCSAYKFFGPHVGILYGRRKLLTEIRPYKLRPSSERLPGRWMTGTQNHEGIAGAAAAVRYLAELVHLPDSQSSAGLSARLDETFRQIQTYELRLAERLIQGLLRIRQLRLYGIQRFSDFHLRVPTFSFTWSGKAPAEIARYLSQRGLFVWHGNHYALPFTQTAGLEPDGTVRVGLMHYNTVEEVDRLLEALNDLSAKS
jgi:cysteine desulfurase family protein (TIGR01976 family)